MADLVEYQPGNTFPGVIGRTVGESSPAWPSPVRAKQGAPNVLFIVVDDIGFGQMNAFGGLINTPNIDRLAAGGLRYTNMHTTALCSPTRSCILTGRNHHSNGMACITEMATGYPGYNGEMPFENGMLSEILLERGYNTYVVGKWHLSPSEENSAAGPYHRWPLGRGFERFYGFLGAETNQWVPDLVEDNHSISPPRTPNEGYHLSEDLADHATKFVRDSYVNAPDKPFFLYFAPGTAHAPHHIWKEWADKYKGKFDMGWDKYREMVFERQKQLGMFVDAAELSRRDPDVPEWDSLPEDHKRLYVRQMEVFAGFVEHCDSQIGRLLDSLEAIDKLDNTLIMLISDNGASAEGGVSGAFNEMSSINYRDEKLEEVLPRIDKLGSPESYNHYAWGWAWAGNTPFRRWKREVYLGGSTDNFIVHWPAGIKAKGEIRTQYAHAIDMVPTVLDALGIEPPATIRGVTQSPIDGVSLAHTFDDAKAETKHQTQYFEMFASRAIDHDGWRAECGYPGPSFTEGAQKGRHIGDVITEEVLTTLDATGWELYHVAVDPAEVHNLAAENRPKLIEMVSRWYTEAGKYQVLPLDATMWQRLAQQRPHVTKDRKQYVYFPDLSEVPAANAPQLYNRAHSIEAEVEIPDWGAEGVLLAHGGVSGGYTFFIKDRRLHYVHNYLGLRELQVTSDRQVPSGVVIVRYEFEPTGEADTRSGKGAPGRGQLYINGVLVGSADFDVTTPIVFGIEGLSCGYDFGDPVTPQYTAPFTFSGTIRKVTVDLSGDLITDPEAEARVLVARQ